MRLYLPSGYSLNYLFKQQDSNLAVATSLVGPTPVDVVKVGLLLRLFNDFLDVKAFVSKLVSINEHSASR